MNNTMHKPLFWKGYWIAAGVLTVLTAAVLVWFWLYPLKMQTKQLKFLKHRVKTHTFSAA